MEPPYFLAICRILFHQSRDSLCALGRDRQPVRKGYLFLTIIVDLDTKEIPDRPDGQADDTLVGILILADIFYGIIQSVSQQC